MKVVGYAGAHMRVHSLWGSAAQYRCITCGRPAAQWSYDGTDPSELQGHDHYSQQRPNGQPMRYSLWPEFYRPLCRSCHKRADLAALSRPFQRGKVNLRSRVDRFRIPTTEAEWDKWLRQNSLT